MAPLLYAANFDPFPSLDCAPLPPPWHNPRKGRDQILQSGNLVQYVPQLTQIIHSIQSALQEWETDEVIGYELYRNIGLAMICIFVISLTMLADVKISLMVMACVILTMVSIYPTF